ncbi:MAG: RNA pyrophosphohydrolase [Planctomycetes bacterium]|nr:RNA pyrophosphohydrolase [Planctomycetota bacterium]
MTDRSYRPNVAAIVRDRDRRILLCERSDHPGSWGFPQGGVKAGEDARAALARELREEIGAEAVRIIAEAPAPLRYDFPSGIGKKGYSGQESTYFLVELAPGAEIRLPADGEFLSYRWIEPDALPYDLVVSFKRGIYRQVLRWFAPWLSGSAPHPGGGDGDGHGDGAAGDAGLAPAARAAEAKPFLVMEVLEEAGRMEAQGEDIVHLEVGEPDFPTPSPIVEEACRALRAGETRYTHNLGIPALRDEIARSFRTRHGVEVDPGRIVVTAGSSPAMLLAFGALLEPGDEVILSDPHYACYPNFIRFLGARVVRSPVDEADGFQLRPEDVRRRITRRTRAIVVNSPANPTGCLVGPDRLAALADLGIPIISDEIYHGLVHEGDARSILEFTESAFVIDGFSKRYAMTGWRLGFAVMPEAFARPIRNLNQSFFISASEFVQRAGIVALRDGRGDVERMAALYDRRRRFLVPALRELGFGVASMPQGAFYVLANARHLDPDSRRLAASILREARVAVTPGVDFGPGGEGFLRFSYANSIDRIREGIARIGAWLARRGSP